jgi:hypothetical protein
MILYSLIYHVADLLRETRHGIVTTGGTTTFVDSLLDEADNVFDSGTCLFQSGRNKLRSTRIVSQVGTLITIEALDYDVIPGVVYSLISPNYPRQNIVAAINSALLELSPIVDYDDLTIDDEDTTGLEEYDLPGYWDVRKVEVSQQTAEPYTWQVKYRWNMENNRIIFPTAITGARLRIWHSHEHQHVSRDEDNTSDDIHPSLLTWLAAYYAALQRFQHVENNEPNTASFLGMAEKRIAELKARYPVHRMTATPKLSSY